MDMPVAVYYSFYARVVQKVTDCERCEGGLFAQGEMS